MLRSSLASPSPKDMLHTSLYSHAYRYAHKKQWLGRQILLHSTMQDFNREPEPQTVQSPMSAENSITRQQDIDDKTLFSNSLIRTSVMSPMAISPRASLLSSPVKRAATKTSCFNDQIVIR